MKRTFENSKLDKKWNRMKKWNIIDVQIDAKHSKQYIDIVSMRES